MIELIVFSLIILFGPLIISIPFVSMFSIENKMNKKFWIIYGIVMFVITIIWSFIWLTQIPNAPIKF